MKKLLFLVPTENKTPKEIISEVEKTGIFSTSKKSKEAKETSKNSSK